jgi:hypothetical protein
MKSEKRLRILWPIILWVIFAVLAVLNAFARETFYQEKLGELLAHQISTGIFIILILGIMVLFFNLSKIKYTKKELWIIGIAWFLGTIFFEFLAGHYLFGNSWQNLLADYNFLKGRLWALVPIVILIGPRITSRKSKLKKKHKYKRKAKKSGKPKMSKQRKWLIAGIIFALVVLTALILFLFVKPAFLEPILDKFNNQAGVTPGGTAHSKETPSSSSPSSGSKTTTNSNTAPRTMTLSTPPVSGLDNSAYYAKLAGLLSQTPMVQDIPQGEQILLRFYNFNTGEREFEKSYILTTRSAKEGFIENPEITITIHSKYLPELSSDNLCATIIKAKTNGDLGVYTDLSTTKILMKFKNMMKYKDCLM